MRRDPLSWLSAITRHHGDLVRLAFPRHTALVVNHPEGVKHVLHTNNRNYDKATPGFDELRNLLGNGLVTAEGDLWLRHRRIAQPAFSRQSIASFAPVITRAVEPLRDRWIAMAPSRSTVNVSEAMTSLTLRIAGETLLSTDLSQAASGVGDALAELLEQIPARIGNPFQFMHRLPTVRNQRYFKAKATLDTVVKEIIDTRRRQSTTTADTTDLLSRLMTARDDQGRALSDTQLHDEVLTVLLAGHETTANALAWTFHLLSLNPLARRALTHELDAVLSNRTPTLDDLAQLDTLRCVIQESMRLRPPVWFIARRAVDRDVLMGHCVNPGTLVFISPWTLHRHPEFWPDPEGFDPSRFDNDTSASRPTTAYIPFGAGPRACIGQSFAMLEAQLIIAMLYQSITLENLSGALVTPEPTVTLRPRHGLRMVLAPRR